MKNSILLLDFNRVKSYVAGIILLHNNESKLIFFVWQNLETCY